MIELLTSFLVNAVALGECPQALLTMCIARQIASVFLASHAQPDP